MGWEAIRGAFRGAGSSGDAPREGATAFETGKRGLDRATDFFATPLSHSPTEAWPGRWLRPKGNLNRGELMLLLAVALAPLLMMAIRISAWPGALGPGLSDTLLPSLGHDLNQTLSLTRIPPGDRESVLYMLLIPTGAVLIALTRMTLGIRVIGFRAILIAVGFQVSGFLPSIILIAVMVGLVVLVRPVLVRLRLPSVARLSVIMCLAVVVLIASLLAAPWLHSDTLWRVAFFPVIVLGLLAEGIAKTLDQDSGPAAVWRTSATIGIALLIAAFSQIPVVREIAIEFPELIFTQIVSIVLISEFLDLRLLQGLDARLSGTPLPSLLAQADQLRIAIVRNHRKSGVIAHTGAASRGGYSRRVVRQIAAELRASGHYVKRFEGDMALCSKLEDFIPAEPLGGGPGGLVLNLAHGIQGDVAQMHVPAMLEMAGLVYVGPTPASIIRTHDFTLFDQTLQAAGIPTPPTERVDAAGVDPDALAYPVCVRPRVANRYRTRIARSPEQLVSLAQAVADRHGIEAVFSPHRPGREFDVALLGNGNPRCLPLVECLTGDERVCPVALTPALRNPIQHLAQRAFAACECRDYAVVRVRSYEDESLEVISIDTTEALSPGLSFERAAEHAGMSYAGLLDAIVRVARARYIEEPLPESVEPAQNREPGFEPPGKPAVVR